MCTAPQGWKFEMSGQYTVLVPNGSGRLTDAMLRTVPIMGLADSDLPSWCSPERLKYHNDKCRSFQDSLSMPLVQLVHAACPCLARIAPCPACPCRLTVAVSTTRLESRASMRMSRPRREWWARKRRGRCSGDNNLRGFQDGQQIQFDETVIFYEEVDVLEYTDEQREALLLACLPCAVLKESCSGSRTRRTHQHDECVQERAMFVFPHVNIEHSC